MRKEKKTVSRRNFLKGFGVVTVGAGTLAACEPGTEENILKQPTPNVSFDAKYPGVPMAPASAPPSGRLRFFTPHEAKTVEGFTARLMPGTPEDPGAREAGVVNYIDYMLDQNQGLVEATYRSGPYVQVYDADEGPPADADEFDMVWVPSDQIERYGYQSILTPADVYRLGLASLDNYSFRKHKKHFLRLTEAEQDGVIQDLVDGNADESFPQFSGTTFFHVVRRHTGEGMFSDPQYGGNRDMAGWKLIGYPGAQRAWTPDEIQMEGLRHPPQALASMALFTAGEDVGAHVHMPVSGSDIELDSRGTIGNSTP